MRLQVEQLPDRVCPSSFAAIAAQGEQTAALIEASFIAFERAIAIAPHNPLATTPAVQAFAAVNHESGPALAVQTVPVVAPADALASLVFDFASHKGTSAA